MNPPFLQDHPRLVFSGGDVKSLRHFARTEAGEALLARMDRALAAEADGITIGSHAAGHALLHVLFDDPSEAATARQIVDRTMAGVRYHSSPPLWDARHFKMIFRTKAAVDVAIAYDLCFDAWDVDFRRTVAKELSKLAHQFTRGGGRGFNDRIYSNWMGNTSAAGGFLALAVLGDAGAGRDLDKTLQRARKRFGEYLRAAYGDRGWCCEGLNYLRYPMTTSGFQFLQALRLTTGEGVSGTPAEWIAPLLVMSLVRSEPNPYVPFFGLNYPASGQDVSGFAQQWERTRWRSGDLVMALGSAAEWFRPAVLWTIDRVFGQTGDGSFEVHKPADAVHALANLALAKEAPANPVGSVGLTLGDEELGHFLFRSRFDSSDDLLAAFHANLDPRHASYSFQDAGSFRIYGLGTRWADQASRKDRHWGRGPVPNISRELENVVLVEGTNGWPGGELIVHERQEDGSGLVAVDLSAAYSWGEDLRSARPSGIEAVRSFAVDYSGASGAAGLYVVADRLAGGPAARKTWQMHTAGRPEPAEDGFIIRGANGATLRGRFIVPSCPAVEIEPGSETSAVRVFGGDGDATFLAVMTLQPAGAEHPLADVRLRSFETRVTVGKAEVTFDGRRICLSGP